MPNRIAVFTRYPKPGQTKTRLIPSVGAEEAANIHRDMAGYTVLTARAAVSTQCHADLEIRYSGGALRDMVHWLGAGTTYTDSSGADLGVRMLETFAAAHEAGCNKTVIIGTDCPGITPDILAQALKALDETPVVLGPAGDGGYYLIGLRAPAPELFADIEWGTGTVLESTLARAASAGLDVHQLETLSDVDHSDDLAAWEQIRPPDAGAHARISVIIPALNEERIVDAVVRHALNDTEEVLVADGGSRDNTTHIAASAGARVIQGHAERAGLMNAAALAATGDTLLFLHADTRLPDGFAAAVDQALYKDAAHAGAFSFSIENASAGLRCIELFTNLRSRLLRFPYGDQAIFMRKSTFSRHGGFANIPIMEDFDLVRRIRQAGPIRTCPGRAVTSARRWNDMGIMRTTWINQRMIAGYRKGKPFEELERLYRRGKGTRA